MKESELKELYNKKKKNNSSNIQETRDIKYIDVQVTASPEDRAAIQKEVDEATAQLATTTDDYTSFIRSVGSDAPYVDLFYNKTAFPSDVVARLDSASVGAVYGPYYNGADNTINSFKIVAKGCRCRLCRIPPDSGIRGRRVENKDIGRQYLQCD